MCREPSPRHVFVESLAEIDPRKVAEVVRSSRHKKKTTPLRPIFSRPLRNPEPGFRSLATLKFVANVVGEL